MDDERDVGLDHGIETAYVGRFDPLQVPILLEVLREHGIFAMTKVALDDAETEQYPFMNEGRGTLLVDRTRLEEARRIIAEEVPKRIEEMRAGLEEDGELSPSEDLVPLGWFEPEVARELVEQLVEAGIGAAPEYPLDLPAPAYAREDGRVRVHVEELFLEEAGEMLEKEVREALAARGVTFTEPLLGTDDS